MNWVPALTALLTFNERLIDGNQTYFPILNLGDFSIVAYAFPPQQQPIPIFCSDARNQHTQGSDCHVSPHQGVFLPCTASALLSHVNRTSLAYWLGCSPPRVLHDSSASDFKSTMMWYAMIMMNLWQAEEKHRCNGVQKHWHSIWRLQELRNQLTFAGCKYDF